MVVTTGADCALHSLLLWFFCTFIGTMLGFHFRHLLIRILDLAVQHLDSG